MRGDGNDILPAPVMTRGNVIDLEIPDVEPGACRTCRAPLIHGFESHMLDCPVLRDEDAEVLPLFPAQADEDSELDSAYEAVFDEDKDKMERLMREFVDALRAAARHPNPGALAYGHLPNILLRNANPGQQGVEIGHRENHLVVGHHIPHLHTPDGQGPFNRRRYHCITQIEFGLLHVLPALNPCEQAPIPLNAVIAEVNQGQRTE